MLGTKTELSQLALDLRKQDKEYKELYSQTLQQIADRFHDGVSRYPRKKPHKWYSLVPQSDWKVVRVR